jgi:hypothetical protein
MLDKGFELATLLYTLQSIADSPHELLTAAATASRRGTGGLEA